MQRIYKYQFHVNMTSRAQCKLIHNSTQYYLRILLFTMLEKNSIISILCQFSSTMQNLVQMDLLGSVNDAYLLRSDIYRHSTLNSHHSYIYWRHGWTVILAPHIISEIIPYSKGFLHIAKVNRRTIVWWKRSNYDLFWPKRLL